MHPCVVLLENVKIMTLMLGEGEDVMPKYAEPVINDIHSIMTAMEGCSVVISDTTNHNFSTLSGPSQQNSLRCFVLHVDAMQVDGRRFFSDGNVTH